MSTDSFPAPAFEGSEKRLELDFLSCPTSPEQGLRLLNRRQIDGVLTQAGCCVVSSRSNEVFDSYVLSESSLFVYPDKIILKTCGTTRLLAAVPLLLELAEGVNLTCGRCKYSRASFLFPLAQPEPHHDFEAEVAVSLNVLSYVYMQPEPHHDFEAEVAALSAALGPLGSRGAAYVLGDSLAGLQWHVFVADACSARAPPTYNLEVCMTDLCPLKAGTFCRSADLLTAAAVTSRSGIRMLLPGADIDDYAFEPCGYSMNALQGSTLATIHVTPEEGFSYASFEISGPSLADLHALETVSKVAEVFNPGQMTISLSVSANDCPWDLLGMAAPQNYTTRGSALQRFAQGGHTVFYSCTRECSSLKLADLPDAIEEIAGHLTGISSMSSEDTVFSEDVKLVEAVLDEREALFGDSAASSRSPSPARVSRVLHPCPLLQGQCSSVIAKVLAAHGAVPIPSGDQAFVDAHIRALVDMHGLEDPLYVLDLGYVMRLYNAWQLAMPRVHPFYAVKCNTDRAMIGVLAAMGAGFDCASEAEVNIVLQAGVHPDRIVYANACKRPKDIRAAASLGVSLTTFDTHSELQKLARWHPDTAALLRIRADDPAARCQLGNKYGAEMLGVPGLLEAAQHLRINVVGVSFHVGSGATNPAAFSEAIALARAVFNQGLALGFDMRILDIGGGFCGGSIGAEGSVELGGVPAAVNAALARHFPDEGSVRIIAEPGRYFAEASASLACMVIGVRETHTPAAAPARDYWVTDGLYGSMNSILYDHATLSAHPLPLTANPIGADSANPNQREVVRSTVFGPTCDGLDTVLRDYPLPLLENGDWLVFPNMGAYSLVGACNFNGIDVTSTSTFYVCSAGNA